MITEWANYFSIASAALAAFYWFRAAVAVVRPTPEQDGSGKGTVIGGEGFITTTINGRRVELVGTLVKQSAANAWGAGFASAAAILQAAALIAKAWQP